MQIALGWNLEMWIKWVIGVVIAVGVTREDAVPGLGWLSDLSDAVSRIAEGSDEDEIVDGPGCHWADREASTSALSRDGRGGRRARQGMRLEIGGEGEQ